MEKVDEDELNEAVREKLEGQGLVEHEGDVTKLIQEDYEENEIQADMEAVDWESAYLAIEETENEVRAEQLKAVQEMERKRAL
jgi:hypothetical protein